MKLTVGGEGLFLRKMEDDEAMPIFPSFWSNGAQIKARAEIVPKILDNIDVWLSWKMLTHLGSEHHREHA